MPLLYEITAGEFPARKPKTGFQLKKILAILGLFARLRQMVD